LPEGDVTENRRVKGLLKILSSIMAMKKMAEIVRINFSRHLETNQRIAETWRVLIQRKQNKTKQLNISVLVPSPTLSCMIAFKNNLLKFLVQSSSHQRECNGTESFKDSFPKNCHYLTCMMVLQNIPTCKVISI